MNCPYCGGPLTLEEMYCPHCGKPNAEGMAHAKAMEKYEKEFTSASEEVHEAAGRYNKVAVKTVILALLCALIVVLIYITSNAFMIRMRINKWDISVNYDKYSAVMEQYIADEDYLSFHAFTTQKSIGTGDEKYQQYYLVDRAAMYYSYIYDNLFQILNPTEYYSGDYMESSLAEYIGDFYKLGNDDRSYYKGSDAQEYLQCYSNMISRVDLMLKTYLGLSEDELEEFKTTSDAKRTITIQEKLSNTEIG